MTFEPQLKQIALTFEAGGDPTICGQMLDILRASGTPATIFLPGIWSDQYPELVRRMAEEGHELGNHSYTHPDLTQADDDAIRHELRRTDETVKQVTGHRAFPWFRPPYDAIDARVRRIALDEGYRLVQRNAVDGGHWQGETTPERIVSRSLENACDGAVIAYHLDSAKTLTVLADVIAQLRAAGYQPVQLSELASVSERPERQPGFAALDVEPGFMQVMQRGARAWSMNVLEFGARAISPTNIPVQLVEADNWSASLLSGRDSPEWLPSAGSDRYVLVLAGTVECSLRARGDPAVRVRAVGRPGDFILWARDCELRAMSQMPTDVSQQWMVLIFE